MEDIRLESVWEEKMLKQGWSKVATQYLTKKWAPTTLASYEKIIAKLKDFCELSDSPFPDIDTATLADYLCKIARQSSRPKSMLNSTLAAIAALSEAYSTENPVTVDIIHLVNALIKTETTRPIEHSKVMPVDSFVKLFKSWPGNWKLKLEDLRLKCITLLALALMLRPSDIAPKSKVFRDDQWQDLVLSTNQVKFNTDGSAVITLFGIKNDYKRDGFEVVLRPTTDAKIDPVKTLRAYIERTRYQRPSHLPLFLQLKSPFDAISSKTVARILDKAIMLAGLTGYSAKSFRPTGASNAIDEGIHPDMVRKIGRWKNQETFEFHYVHSKPPSYVTDCIYKVRPSTEEQAAKDVQMS